MTDITRVYTPPELEYIKSRATDEVTVPDNDKSLLAACKKKANVNRFYNRTAGIMALVGPCGIIVKFAEMYTCESPTQCHAMPCIPVHHIRSQTG